MISLKDISVTFNQSKKPAIQAVKTYRSRGTCTASWGYSGAGKAQYRPCDQLAAPSGSVVVNGTELTTLSAKDLREKRKTIGMIFQHFNLMDSRNVFDNVDFP